MAPSNDEPQTPDDTSDELPWLREMVEEDLLGLFGESRREVARTARTLMVRAEGDPTVAEALVEAAQTAVLRGNDDTQASSWMLLILAELRDPIALPVLFAALGSDDEMLQEIAVDAVLHFGAAAVEPLLERMEQSTTEEGESALFSESAYRVLSQVGSFEDPPLRERVMDFLLDRVEWESSRPAGACRVEALFQASAVLGDRRMLAPMDRVLKLRFRGRNAAIADALEMLRDNTDGAPVVHDPPPWIEAHRWLFDADLEGARVKRPGARAGGSEASEGDAGDSSDDEAEDGETRRTAGYLWGLNAVAKARSEEDDDDDDAREESIDARRFIEKPTPRSGGEQDDGEQADGEQDETSPPA